MSACLEQVIADALRIDVTNVSDDLEFGVTPEWDSLNHVALMMSIEAEFDIKVTDDDVVELTNVPAIRRFLGSRATGT